MKKSISLVILTIFGLFFSCEKEIESNPPEMIKKENKKVIYQVFTRLFGNDNTNNKPWGTLEENGVGKFNDFTPKALAEIRKLGVSHIWYTGILHHAMVADYTDFGISNDDPDVVKGRAGSPYAVKDYYSVDPDMAEDPAKRMEEFQALIDRTHEQEMKVIIDIVPNHIARKYEGMNNPKEFLILELTMIPALNTKRITISTISPESRSKYRIGMIIINLWEEKFIH